MFACLVVADGRPVPRDELAEALWEEAPPASWERALSGIISKLRLLLNECGVDGPSALTNAFGCYQLVLPEGSWVDVIAADTALAESGQALAAGDSALARDLATTAGSLARPPFLPGEEGRWVASVRADRRDLLFRSLEMLAEASRLSGDAAGAVRAAEEVTALEPFRETGHRLLMQAHAANGNDAEALRAYERCRRLLDEELGTYPSSETKAVYVEVLRSSGTSAVALEELTREPSPELVPEQRREPVEEIEPRSLSKGRMALLLGAVLALVAVGVGAAALRGGDDKAPAAAGAAPIDPETGELLDGVALGTSPWTVAIGEGSVWALDAEDRTISRIDPESKEVLRTFSISSTPTDVAAGAGAVWIGNGTPEDGILPRSISRLDPASGVVTETFELPPPPPRIPFDVFPAATSQHIAVTQEAVWVVNPDFTVTRIDPRSNRVVGRVTDVRALNVAAGDGEVWVTEGGGIAKIDTGTNAVARRVPIDSMFLGAIAIGGGAVWVLDPEGAAVRRVGTSRGAAVQTIELDRWVSGIAFGEGGVWATNEIADAVHRIDPRTGAAERIETAASPRGVAAGEGGVWVTTAAQPSPDAALPSAVCSDVHFDGEGAPDLLVVSDLTLKGGMREVTAPMADAIKLVLEQRDFRAGGFSVGYQSCDNATTQTGAADFFRCGSNAKSYARNLRVVAVLGSYVSPCSYTQIPIANEARGGPLAMLSPSSTYDGLTQEEPLAPTGTRSFFRIVAADRFQAAAHVTLATKLGHSRVFLLTSPDGEYGDLFPPSFREAAAEQGVELVGSGVFDPYAPNYSILAREVARTRPQAISIAGTLTPKTGQMLQELRRAVPDASLLLGERFGFVEGLVELAGPAAQGAYLVTYGIPNDRLPPRGRAFLRSFAATRAGDPGPDLAASYGAQGAEILLDAIARSDGSRASVTEELRKTHVENGILGDVRFDETGELVDAPLTVYRVEGKRFVVDRMVTVRSS